MKKNSISRRHFLKVSGLISLGFTGLNMYACNGFSEAIGAPLPGQRGYGPLRHDPMGILELPKNFTYRVISRQGDKMSDGFFVPGKADGMACFEGPNGECIIIRNHEVSPEMYDLGPFGPKNLLLKKLPKDKIYDMGRGQLPCLGGTTTMIYNTQTQQLEREFLSLAGTSRNCSGGPTPWNSWITCEETVDRAGGRLEKNHGYTFEVPATVKNHLADPIPIKAMGRFQHEAIAIDPRTGIVYETEDRNDSVIYRYLPKVRQRLQAGGKLQALKIKGKPGFDTRNWPELDTDKCEIGRHMEVEWIDCQNVDSQQDDLRLRMYDLGATRFARGEGMWFGRGECFFACTTGGKKHQGQIFRYTPSPYEGTPREKEAPGKLELYTEPNNSRLLQNCDNITFSPLGDLVLCEDNHQPRIMGITPQGAFYPIAKNIGYPSEFAGAAFSPDGSTLFVNIQHAGLTLAITGPWM